MINENSGSFSVKSKFSQLSESASLYLDFFFYRSNFNFCQPNDRNSRLKNTSSIRTLKKIVKMKSNWSDLF